MTGRYRGQRIFAAAAEAKPIVGSLTARPIIERYYRAKVVLVDGSPPLPAVSDLQPRMRAKSVRR